MAHLFESRQAPRLGVVARNRSHRRRRDSRSRDRTSVASVGRRRLVLQMLPHRLRVKEQVGRKVVP